MKAKSLIILLLLTMLIIPRFNEAQAACGDGVVDSNEECERSYDCATENICNALCECIDLKFEVSNNQ